MNEKKGCVRLPLSNYACSAAVTLSAILILGCATTGVDAATGATASSQNRSHITEEGQAGTLIVLAASEGKSTSKIADAIAEGLGADVLSPNAIAAEEFGMYGLVGFGSGIFDQAHHQALLELTDRLPYSPGLKVFIFSTSGVSRRFAMDHQIDDPHTPLRERLLKKGYNVVGEFNCAGFNDNSFLKLFGGMNRGRPTQEDLALAKAFAERLKSTEMGIALVADYAIKEETP